MQPKVIWASKIFSRKKENKLIRVFPVRQNLVIWSARVFQERTPQIAEWSEKTSLCFFSSKQKGKQSIPQSSKVYPKAAKSFRWKENICTILSFSEWGTQHAPCKCYSRATVKLKKLLSLWKLFGGLFVMIRQASMPNTGSSRWQWQGDASSITRDPLIVCATRYGSPIVKALPLFTPPHPRCNQANG